jgi:hypothetical protein
MLDKILYVVGKSVKPLQLLQSVLSPFLWIGTMVDSFHSPGSSSLFQIAMISLYNMYMYVCVCVCVCVHA